VEYRTDVFDGASVEALVGRLVRVLVSMTGDPARRLSVVDVLGVDEHVVLDGWGNRGVLSGSAPGGVSIPAVFAAAVARCPSAVAVSFAGRVLTYRELDEASNRLAHLLVGQGVGPGRSVVLLLNRSAEAVVAMVAVLKAGAAYLAIDPSAPDGRVEFMVADAAPVVAITSAELAERLGGCGLVVVDVDDPGIADYPCTALPGPAADDVAYLIYTSGTTGVPKGVAVTHANVTELMESL
ncbi:AMP-binding protein, partial [Mycobacterium sp. CPCC 205372]